MILNLKEFEEAKKSHQRGDLDKAIILYKHLLEKNNEVSQLHFFLGTALLQKKNYEEAYHSLNQAIKLKNDVPNYFNNIGIVLSKLGREEEAIYNYNEALKLNPSLVDALINIGISYKNLKKHEKANKFLHKSLELDPNNPSIFNNIGNYFKEIGDITKAVVSYDKAIKLKEDYVEAHNNKGEILLLQKKFKEAIAEFKLVLKLDPFFSYALGKLIHCKMNICDWSDFEQNLSKITTGINNNVPIIEPFPLLSLIDDVDLQQKNSQIYIKAKYQNKMSKKIKIKKNNKEKIKIGYFGAEFYNHPVLQLTRDIFINHDKSNFDIYAFSHSPIKDNAYFNIKNHFKEFFDINKLSDQEVLGLSKKIGIDIAINFTGYTADSRNEIFLRRVAPIQVNYLGFSATMGTKNIDYIIGDKFLIPEKHYKNYTEKVVNLPNTFFPSVTNMEISAKNLTKSSLKLPEDKFIFGCFNNTYKITPKIFETWMKILKITKNSVLWILSSSNETKESLRNNAKDKGIDPNRIIFAEKMSHSDHLKRFKFMDLFLDTFPYNAHTTASEAIRCGVPIITISGQSFVSRVAGSLLTTIRADNLICKDVNEYTEKAVQICNNLNEFKNLKEKFHENKTKIIFNSRRYTRDLENIYKDLIFENN